MTANGWVEWATRRDGPANKVYSQANRQQGIVLHSVEGWLTGAFGELDKPERQASWHFTLGLDGTLYQHYRLVASCWASGNVEANTRYVAMESEGIAGTPLTEAQVATAKRLLQELGFAKRGVDIWEHREVWDLSEPNAGPTACPSDRYEPLYAALEDEVSREEYEALARRVETLELAMASGGEESGETREQRVTNAGYRLTQVANLEPYESPSGGMVLRPSLLDLAYQLKGRMDAFSQRTAPGLAADR